MVSLQGRKLVAVYYGLGRVHIFEFALGWVGLGRVTENGPTATSM